MKTTNKLMSIEAQINLLIYELLGEEKCRELRNDTSILSQIEKTEDDLLAALEERLLILRKELKKRQ